MTFYCLKIRFKMRNLFAFFLLVIILKIVTAVVIKGPEDNYISSLGVNITLACTVQNHNAGLANWYRLKPSDASEGGGTFCSVPSNGDKSGCPLDTPYDNFELVIANNGTYNHYDIEITSVEDVDLGEYDCYFGTLPNSGSLLCLQANPENVYVKFDGEEYNTSNSDIILDRQNYTLEAIANNSMPETTFAWDISGLDSISGLVDPTSYSHDGGCELFTSISSLTYDFSNVEPESEFTIMLTATNEETGYTTTIVLSGMIAAELTTVINPTTANSAITNGPGDTGGSTTKQPLSVGVIIGIVVGAIGLILFVILLIYIIRVKRSK